MSANMRGMAPTNRTEIARAAVNQLMDATTAIDRNAVLQPFVAGMDAQQMVDFLTSVSEVLLDQVQLYASVAISDPAFAQAVRERAESNAAVYFDKTFRDLTDGLGA